MRRNVELSGKGLSKELKSSRTWGVEGVGRVKNGFPGSQSPWSLLSPQGKRTDFWLKSEKAVPAAPSHSGCLGRQHGKRVPEPPKSRNVG